jgi:hypothetical protein
MTLGSLAKPDGTCVERNQFVMELPGKDSRGMANRRVSQVQHHDMTRIPAGTMDFS